MKKIILLAIALAFTVVSCDSKKGADRSSEDAKDSLNIEQTNETVLQNETFEDITLNKTFEDFSGNAITFKELIAKHKGNAIVIDVWASWCPDCIKGFPELKKLQEKYPTTSYVFLSLDKTKDKWKESIKKHELIGEHYYLNEKMNDEFGKSINLDWIPRYIVVDTHGNIALKKAIVANDSLLIQTLDKLQP